MVRRRLVVRRTAAVVAAAVLALTACGQEEVRTVATSSDPQELRNVDWQLQTLQTGDGPVRPVGDVVAVLRVSARDQVGGHACNHWGGTGQVGPGTLRVTDLSTTLMGCTGLRSEIDDVTQDLLRAGASWTIDDGTLALAGPATRLTYRAASTPWSRPKATTLVEGAFGDAVYRLAWEVSPDNQAIGVDWESRDERGVGLSSSGIGRSATEDITYLDPSGASVAGHGFVYVAAPRSIERVTWDGPGGTHDLARYDLPAAKTWHLFAGFVRGSTKGGQAVGYAAGEERMRSRVLPY